MYRRWRKTRAASSRQMREHIANAAGQIARVAVLTLPVLACDGQPAAGGYRWPEALIGIALDADAQTETTEALTAYAAEHGLHRYRVVEDPVANKAKRENPLFQRETSYNPSPANSPYGFSFILSKLSPQCWTVRFFERSSTWSQESINAFNSLVEHLQSVTRTQSSSIRSSERVAMTRVRLAPLRRCVPLWDCQNRRGLSTRVNRRLLDHDGADGSL